MTGNDSEKKLVDLFYMPPSKDYVLPDETISDVDLDRFYGRDGTGQIGLCQTFVFDPLLKDIHHFYSN